MQFLLRPLLLPVFLLIPFISSAAGAAGTYEGKVISVADGDTVGVPYKGGRLKVRLAEIDTPEKGQPYGTRARQALSALVFNRAVNVAETDRDRYGRIVGRVYAGGADVSAEMMQRGHAWAYRKYAADPRLYRLEEGGPAGQARALGTARSRAYASLGVEARSKGGVFCKRAAGKAPASRRTACFPGFRPKLC